jgi:hypothetical protein
MYERAFRISLPSGFQRSSKRGGPTVRREAENSFLSVVRSLINTSIIP